MESENCNDTSDVAVQTHLNLPDNNGTNDSGEGEVTETASPIVIYSNENSRCKNRKLPCYFCDHFMFHMRRHLERQHSSLPEVAEVYGRSNPSERSLGILNIINQGTYKHNSRVLKNNSGVLLVARAPKTSRNPSEFLPCSYCLQFFVQKELYRHGNCCKFRPTDMSEKSMVASARALLSGSVAESDVKISPELKECVISRMRVDSLRRTAISDRLIVQLGSLLLQKLGHKPAVDISARMRELARLLTALRQGERQTWTLSDFISCNGFDMIVHAIEREGGSYTNEDGRRLFKTPAYVIKVAGSLLKCAQLKRGIALRTGNSTTLTDADNFLTLHNGEITDKLVSAAHASYRVRGNTLAEFPDEEDLQRLRRYLMTEMERLKEEVVNQPDIQSWRELAELTMTRVLVFNGRRGAEVADLKVSDFANASSEVDQGIAAQLNSVERKLLDRLKAFFLYRAVRSCVVRLFTMSLSCEQIGLYQKPRA